METLVFERKLRKVEAGAITLSTSLAGYPYPNANAKQFADDLESLSTPPSADDFVKYVNFWQSRYPSSITDIFKRWLFALCYSPDRMNVTMAAYNHYCKHFLDQYANPDIWPLNTIHENGIAISNFNDVYWRSSDKFSLHQASTFIGKVDAACTRLELLGVVDSTFDTACLLVSLLYPIGSDAFLVPANVKKFFPSLKVPAKFTDTYEKLCFMKAWTASSNHIRLGPGLSFYTALDRATKAHFSSSKLKCKAELMDAHDFSSPLYWGKVFNEQ